MPVFSTPVRFGSKAKAERLSSTEAPWRVEPPWKTVPPWHVDSPARLPVVTPNDPSEREADRLADEIMGIRAIRANQVPAQEAAGPGALATSPGPSIEGALGSSGRPLDGELRAFMEPRLGADLATVRVHTGAAAERSAHDLGAAAFTVGRDVVFGARQFEPRTVEGQHLIAHELAHVAQEQRRPSGAPRLHRKPESAATPHAAGTPIAGEVTTRFDEPSRRWLIAVDGIPVAEVSVASKETSFQLGVEVAGRSVQVTLRHFGGAMLAPAVNAEATPAFSATLTEIDARQGEPGGAGPTPPVFAGQADTGTADLVLGPTSMIPRRPPAGAEASRETGFDLGTTPGTFSEFEEQIGKDPSRITAVVLDPASREVIGYRLAATTGLTRLVDREGSEVFLHEIGIEQPVLDPIDFIPTPGTVLKTGAGIAGKAGLKTLTAKSAAAGLKIPLGIIARMRGVSRALTGRVLRKVASEAPGFVRRITLEGLDHSFDRHAAQWFGRAASRATHFGEWRVLIERVAASKQIFPWSTGTAATIAHLGRVEGKYFVVQFFVETGELATAFVPSASQLREMLKLLALAR